jgi:hypothetical protein
MSTATKVPALPGIPRTNDPSLSKFLESVKQWIEVREGDRGDSLDRAITLRELFDAGIAKKKPNISLTGRDSGDFIALENINYTVPPKIENLVASGIFGAVILEWEQPLYTNYQHVEVWRSQANDVGTAKRIGTSVPNVFMDYVADQTTYFYWAKGVTTANVVGPFNAVAGVSVSTSDSPEYIMQVLSDVTANADTPFVFDNGAFYLNANAFIKSATILDAMIYSVKANKITAGTITAAVELIAAKITGGSLNINNKFVVDEQGNTVIRSGTSGARTETTNQGTRVYDTNGVLRVKLGNLS